MDALLESSKMTPMMAQWHECKLQAKDALLLFRLGDFYEAFHEDAFVLSKELDLTLTKRCDVPMSGIPFHASENYIDLLLEKGFKVAIAEQMEDPKEVKGIVKREVVRIATPGTLVQSSLLKDKCPNYLGAIHKINTTFGLAILDISTGDFFAIQVESLDALQDELACLQPKELLISAKCIDELSPQTKASCLCTKLEEWKFEHKSSVDTLTKHFRVHTLDSFGLKGLPAAINAASALLHYVNEELSLPIQHIETIRVKTAKDSLSLDRTTQKHLEILEALHENSPSLLSHLDATSTPMGGRLLRDWLMHPLLSPEAIRARQEAIAELMKFESLLESLKPIRDLERLIMRISSGVGGPRDLLSLKISLEAIEPIKQLLKSASSFLLLEQRDNLCDLSPLIQAIKTTLNDEPPLRLSDGGVIRTGVHPQLDELRALQSSGHEWISEYQRNLRESTGIKTLKVGFTKAFGYYIEVSRGQADKMPESFIRRQTLVNSERFLSTELKEYEQKIYSAEEKIQLLEVELFSKLKEACRLKGSEIRRIAKSIACIDVLAGFASLAKKRRYICPLIDEENRISIQGGKHPIIEACLPMGEFVPNDVELSEKQRLHLITGPNMAGKSTFIRQVALLVIMAQIGSFIPAEFAQIGLVDKIFSRIGASDDLSRGQSTFMVEMSETANILHHATSRSLVILDEIGRGTSTYDGIAIAWAVAEYLLTATGKQAKTLFATHYWELHTLQEKIPGVANFQVAVAETHEGIVFLHKIVSGEADKSYGIHVAKLAGLPSSVIRKAEEILSSLEKEPKPKPQKQKQLDLFGISPANEAIEEMILSQLHKCDPNQLTPIDALKMIADWKCRLQ